MTKASVIVTTYNRQDRIELCLTALLKQDCEIVVADDGSEDDTFTRIYMGEYPVKYVWHPHNGWGLAKTRNMGARQATGDLLIFIDSDILLNPCAVQEYLSLYEQNPNRVIGGYYKYLKGMKIGLKDVEDWWGVWNMTLPEIQVDQHLVPVGYDVREAWHAQGKLPQLFGKDHEIVRSPFCLLGGNMGVPRHIWEQTEGFDEGITCYGGEDGEFSLQVAELGYGFSFSRAVAGCHMAHPKAPGAVENEAKVYQHIVQRHPRYFKDGVPCWNDADFAWPEDKSTASSRKEPA